MRKREATPNPQAHRLAPMQDSQITPTVEGASSPPPAPAQNHALHTVALDFMVVPELLATLAYVPDAVRCKVVDPDAIFLTGILGESGRRLVRAGIEFYFTRKLATKLIAAGIAVKAQTRPSSATVEETK